MIIIKLSAQTKSDLAINGDIFNVWRSAFGLASGGAFLSSVGTGPLGLALSGALSLVAAPFDLAAAGFYGIDYAMHGTSRGNFFKSMTAFTSDVLLYKGMSVGYNFVASRFINPNTGRFIKTASGVTRVGVSAISCTFWAL